ncbi:septum formation initiator [Azospirillum thiophilum]|uniref:Septum formation initiator n=1 Tax=Azospirillum thiophilum TaxID=528244 RepID=A0AAC8ZSW6_9PROT|nr:septum formation initiator [Azospirillum thiophilum]ALG69697.1 septum formation initiator [Azospirillum thiophilum]KJR66623.1 septum formation initiator [Azospirillum thiophilum]
MPPRSTTARPRQRSGTLSRILALALLPALLMPPLVLSLEPGAARAEDRKAGERAPGEKTPGEKTNDEKANGEKANGERPGGERRADDAQGFDPQRSVTTHSLPLPGGPLAYTATAEFLPLRDGAREELAARIFTVTYTADPEGPGGGAERGPRPVTFVFNGGPGAASAYMHLGAAGPVAVAFGPDGALPPPPARLVDNRDSWLAFTDLVFIDPVGTGFSRAVKPDETERRFWSVDGDTRSMAEIVRLWLTRNGRWSSPTFLAGESYGGFRIAKMAEELIDQVGLAVNGLILVSPVVDFAAIDEDGILGPAWKLPAMAAAAAALGRAPGTPGQAAEAAENFALGPYLTGLAGLDYGRLDAGQDVFAAVARLTGLPVEIVRRQRGRVPMGVFTRELLRDQGRILSIYDGTFTAPDPDPGAARIPFDPFLKGTVPTYTTAFAAYVHDALGLRTDTPYRLLSDRVNRGWEWPRMSVPSAVDALQTALTLQPALRVLIAHGRTDLITPYMASRWVVSRLELPPGERGRVAVTVHPGGHMMYTRAEGRAGLAADARALIEAALAGR